MKDLNLRENIEKAHKQGFDLDTFGQLMDKVIKESNVGLLVTKEENSDDWKILGAGCGAVMDFYIFLNALEPLFLKMLEEMNHQIDPEMLAGNLSELVKASMIAAAKKEVPPDGTGSAD